MPIPNQAQSSPQPVSQLSPADPRSPSPVHSTQATIFSLSGPTPPVRFYHDRILLDRIQKLEKGVQQLSGHIKMVELELQNTKQKSNQQDGRASKRRKLNVEARVLTSAEGKKLAAEKEHVAKVQKKKEAERFRKEKEVARDQRRRARPPDDPFIGSLSSKNKADLQEIAGALSLPKYGTKDALILRINAFFDSNPVQRSSLQFSGLFNRRAPRQSPQETENPHPVASTTQSTLAHRPLADNIINLPNVSKSRPLDNRSYTTCTYDNFFATLHSANS